MRFDILSLFPDYFKGPFDVSMIKRAKEKGLLEINLVNIRDFAEGRHQQVDDRPYGGGPGMVLMAEPVAKAIRNCKSERSHVIYLTPQGKPLTAKRCAELSEKPHLVILCGHYEGVDERVIENAVDEEISIGDYVLTSGAPAAIVLVDSVSRFIPGVIGNEEAPRQDSFENGMFDAPVYTRPPIFEEKDVPPVLRQGNHAEIEAWRKNQAKEKTKKVRPELLKQET
ncbi:MAG: tRNA (guanosine(37)-N1)-methyltransferase TrmD [Chlamydiia bacterium]|nr:tRNA (guanosine(37)-N1)-methyltransferase TrmD [Chlamydiia bacterium]